MPATSADDPAWHISRSDGQIHLGQMLYIPVAMPVHWMAPLPSQQGWTQGGELTRSAVILQLRGNGRAHVSKVEHAQPAKFGIFMWAAQRQLPGPPTWHFSL
jgi:hypothetical protein